MDLTVDASQATDMLIVLSVPQLDSQQTFPTRFLPGKTKNSLTLNIKMVLLARCLDAQTCALHCASMPVTLLSSTRIAQ